MITNARWGRRARRFRQGPAGGGSDTPPDGSADPAGSAGPGPVDPPPAGGALPGGEGEPSSGGHGTRGRHRREDRDHDDDRASAYDPRARPTGEETAIQPFAAWTGGSHDAHGESDQPPEPGPADPLPGTDISDEGYWWGPPARQPELTHPGDAGPGSTQGMSAVGERPGPRFPGGRAVAAFGVAVLLVGSVSMGVSWLLGRSDQTRTAANEGPATASPVSSKARAQAGDIDALLRDSSSTRDRVIAAVVNLRNCQQIDTSIRDLRAAARQRERLVGRLGEVTASRVPQAPELLATLERAWTASATADRAFASWGERIGARGGCPDGEPVTGSHYRKAVRSSAAAGRAKEEFVQLWNPVVAKVGLPQRSEQEI